MKDTPYTEWSRELGRTRSRGEVASWLLDEVGKRSLRALRTPHVLRVALHLRDATGYNGMYLRELSASPAEGVPASTTAWRAVVEQQRALLLNVLDQELWIDGRAADLPVGVGAKSTFSSRHLLLDRLTTHIVLLPVRAPLKPITGFLAVELHVDWNSARVSDAFDAIIPELQALVDVSAAYLWAHRCSPTVHRVADEWMPIVGVAMQRCVDLGRRFANADDTILLTGETGVGKSRFARWLHEQSPRKNGPFVTLSLGSTPGPLRHARLFGHAKGAFTGADTAARGAIDEATDGTLFLDDVDGLDIEGQRMLLEVLDSGQWSPLGASRPKRAEIRFIVATHVDLDSLVEAGAFRRDLMYRLDTLRLHLPSMDQRRDEIPSWAHLFLDNRTHNWFTDDALRLLERAFLPGNLRQLRSLVRRAQMASDGEGAIQVEHVQSAVGTTSLGSSPSTTEALRRFAEDVARIIAAAPDAGPDLDMFCALGDHVLLRLVALVGEDAAFSMLGMARQLHQHNHRRRLQRARTRVAELERWLRRSP